MAPSPDMVLRERETEIASVLRGANLWMSVDDVPRSRRTWQLAEQLTQKVRIKSRFKITRHRGPNRTRTRGNRRLQHSGLPLSGSTCSHP